MGGAPASNRGLLREYATIVVDPPWPSPDYRGKVGRVVGGGETWERHALPYPSMSLDEIAAVSVGELAAADARLFCWATNHYLPFAFLLLQEWGFVHQQTLVWHKTNASPYPGAVAALDLEFLVVARRGRPARLATTRSSLISTSITRHSAKPEAFLDLVEQVSPGPYLELFARRNRLGWDTWGNEALEHVSLAVNSGV